MRDDPICERCGWPIAPWEQVVVAVSTAWPLSPETTPRPQRAASVATFHKRHWTDGGPDWAKLGAGYAQRPDAA